MDDDQSGVHGPIDEMASPGTPNPSRSGLSHPDSTPDRQTHHREPGMWSGFFIDYYPLNLYNTDHKGFSLHVPPLLSRSFYERQPVPFGPVPVPHPCGSLPTYSADLVLNNVPVKVFFSPNGGCTQAIIDDINDAMTEILVQAYSSTSTPIAKALLAAHERGVRGAFSFTRSAESLLIRRSAEHTKAYEENWSKHREHSEE